MSTRIVARVGEFVLSMQAAGDSAAEFLDSINGPEGDDR